jgi:hypothetical protein
VREHQPRRRLLDSELQVRQQLVGNGNHFIVTTLGGRVSVGAANVDDAIVQIDVGLLEPEQLAFAHAAVDRGGHQRSPSGWDHRQHSSDLIVAQVGRLALGNLLLRDPIAVDRVRAVEPLRPLRRGEDAADEHAEMVESRWPELFYAIEIGNDFASRDLSWRKRCQRAGKQPVHGAQAPGVGPRPGQMLLDPPRHHVGKGRVRVDLRGGIEPEPNPILLDL